MGTNTALALALIFSALIPNKLAKTHRLRLATTATALRLAHKLETEARGLHFRLARTQNRPMRAGPVYSSSWFAPSATHAGSAKSISIRRHRRLAGATLRLLAVGSLFGSSSTERTRQGRAALEKEAARKADGHCFHSPVLQMGVASLGAGKWLDCSRSG